MSGHPPYMELLLHGIYSPPAPPALASRAPHDSKYVTRRATGLKCCCAISTVYTIYESLDRSDRRGLGCCLGTWVWRIVRFGLTHVLCSFCGDDFANAKWPHSAGTAPY